MIARKYLSSSDGRPGELRGFSGMEGSSWNLLHRQEVGVLKRQDGQVLPDPGKGPFAPGSQPGEENLRKTVQAFAKERRHEGFLLGNGVTAGV